MSTQGCEELGVDAPETAVAHAHNVVTGLRGCHHLLHQLPDLVSHLCPVPEIGEGF